MRLHRLALTDFKGIERREITFPDSGVLVVEGRNEVGKTSMIEALDLLFEHKDSSRRADIRAAQPVGHDVGPCVEVEISTGPYRFTLLKQWMKQPRTELRIDEPRREQLTGEAAHHRARAILAETVDLPLWRALRLMQATPLLQADLASSSSLSSALDAAAGSAHDAGAAGESLLAAAEENYLRYFTARSAAATGEYKAAIERVDTARAQVSAAELSLDEVAHDVDLHERLTTELQAGVARRDDARRLRAEAARRWDTVAGLDEAVKQAVRVRDQARRDLERATERRDERRALAEEVERRSLALDVQAAAVAELQSQIAPREVELGAAREAHEQAVAAEQQARRRHERAVAEVARRRDLRDLADLETRVERIDAAATRRRLADAALARAGVTDAALAGIERAARAVEVALAAMAAGSASVSVESLAGEQIVEVDGEQVVVRGSGTLSRAVTDRVELVVPGQLRFVVRPEADAAQRAKVVDDARATLRGLLDAAGVNEVEQARELHEQRRIAQVERDQAHERLDDLLDGDDRAALGERLERLRVTCAESGGEQAPGPGAGGDGSAAGSEKAPASAARTRRSVAAARSGAQTVTVTGDTDVLFDFGSSAGSGGGGGVAQDDLFGDAAVDEAGAAAGAAQGDALGGAEVSAAGSESATQGGPPRGAGSDAGTRGGEHGLPGGAATGALQPGAAQPDDDLDLDAAREAAEAARDDLARCATRLEAVRVGVDTQRLELARAESLAAAVRDELQAQCARLAARRDTAADDVLDGDVATAAAELEAAQATVSVRVAELGGHDVDALRVELETLDAELTGLDASRRKLDDEIIRVEARLEQAGRQGRAETYDVARTELERATRAHESLRRHAEAARLLHTTLQQQSQAAKATYVRPFTEAVDRLGRLVYGAGFEIEVDERLVVVARVLDGRRIPYAALSTGAKEQLAILTRLACATLVDGEAGVPVIIDDALGHSDPDKLRRVCAAVGRVDRDAQVVLLTCTPGRYAAIGDATVVRL